MPFPVKKSQTITIEKLSLSIHSHMEKECKAVLMLYYSVSLVNGKNLVS